MCAISGCRHAAEIPPWEQLIHPPTICRRAGVPPSHLGSQLWDVDSAPWLWCSELNGPYCPPRHAGEELAPLDCYGSDSFTPQTWLRVPEASWSPHSEQIRDAFPFILPPSQPFPAGELPQKARNFTKWSGAHLHLFQVTSPTLSNGSAVIKEQMGRCRC